MKGRIRKREQDPWIASRVRVLQGVGLALFFLLLGRLYWLQVVKYEEFRTLSENNRIRIRVVRAPRGAILDRKGLMIGVTEGSYDLIVTPVDVGDLDGELQLLSKVVEFDPGEIREKILKAKEANPYRSITVARDLRFEQVSVVEFNREALPGFSILVEAKRSSDRNSLMSWGTWGKRARRTWRRPAGNSFRWGTSWASTGSKSRGTTCFAA